MPILKPATYNYVLQKCLVSRFLCVRNFASKKLEKIELAKRQNARLEHAKFIEDNAPSADTRQLWLDILGNYEKDIQSAIIVAGAFSNYKDKEATKAMKEILSYLEETKENNPYFDLYGNELKSAIENSESSKNLVKYSNLLSKKPEEKSKTHNLKNIQILAAYKQRLNFISALKSANEQKFTIAPNTDLDLLLNDSKYSKIFEKMKNGFPAVSGTLIIYAGINQPLPAEIIYENLIFQVPEKFQGKLNCALAINHGFDVFGNPFIDAIENTNAAGRPDGTYTIKCDENMLKLIENFPKFSGSYNHVESDFGIPISAIVISPTPNSGYFSRSIIAFIGLLARYYDDFLCNDRLIVGGVGGSSRLYRLGVLGYKEST